MLERDRREARLLDAEGCDENARTAARRLEPSGPAAAPFVPGRPLTRLRRFLTGRTDRSTDCAALRRWERTLALGFVPLENAMWSQRRRWRSWEMWSHIALPVYGRTPAIRLSAAPERPHPAKIISKMTPIAR